MNKQDSRIIFRYTTRFFLYSFTKLTHFMKFKSYHTQKMRMGIYKILIIKTVIHLIVIGATYRKICKIKI